MKNSRLASWKTALPFLLPSLAGFVVFSIIPMIMQIFFIIFFCAFLTYLVTSAKNPFKTGSSALSPAS